MKQHTHLEKKLQYGKNFVLNFQYRKTEKKHQVAQGTGSNEGKVDVRPLPTRQTHARHLPIV